MPRFEFGFPTGRFSRSASIAIQIPNDPRLVGTPVFGQTILEGLEFGAVSWGSIGR